VPRASLGEPRIPNLTVSYCLDSRLNLDCLQLPRRRGRVPPRKEQQIKYPLLPSRVMFTLDMGSIMRILASAFSCEMQ